LEQRQLERSTSVASTNNKKFPQQLFSNLRRVAIAKSQESLPEVEASREAWLVV
jgi:hypothetical protein